MRVGVGSVVLLLLAPFAAAARWWSRRRRGVDPRVGWELRSGRPFDSIDATVDVPAGREVEARTEIIDAVVRVAELLHRDDDVFHVVFRKPWEADATLVAVGPQPQELAERLAVSLGSRTLEGMTQIWLTLPAARHLGEVVDPARFDPESLGAPERLAASAAPRWAMTTAFVRRGPSAVFRLRLTVPPPSSDDVAAVFERLRRRLS